MMDITSIIMLLEMARIFFLCEAFLKVIKVTNQLKFN
jgi:hypothetical protein